MCLRRKENKNVEIVSKFHLSEFVDFWHKDDVYFGVVTKIKENKDGKVLYDIDIAGQCPTTFQDIPEDKLIRIHKR